MGVGKTTLCKWILERFQNASLSGGHPPMTRIVSFGATMKREAAEIYGFPLSWAYNNKDALVTIRLQLTPRKFIKPGWEEGQVSVREIMQYFATDVIRKENPDHWIEAVDNTIRKLKMPENGGYRLFLIDDVRFPNELEYVKQNGVCYRIKPYIGYRYNPDPHISETALDDAVFDDECLPQYGELKALSRVIYNRIRDLYGG